MISRRFYFISLLVLLTGGCGTVTQSPVTSQQASYDDNMQNSGILNRDHGTFIVSEAFKNRYNALIEIYGNSKLEDGSPIFVPALKKDQGVSYANGQWRMTIQAMSYMVRLSLLQKRGFKP
jgi:hypothetical protein